MSQVKGRSALVNLSMILYKSLIVGFIHVIFAIESLSFSFHVISQWAFDLVTGLWGVLPASGDLMAPPRKGLIILRIQDHF
jgi:hypothetical protein